MAACQAFLSFTVSLSLLKLMSTESVMPSNHLILCCPLLLPSILSSNRVFSNELALCIRWPKYWSLSFSISLSNKCLELISFRINWFDLLAVPRTLKSLLQYHSLKASILQCSAFFMIQLSHLYLYSISYKVVTAGSHEQLWPPHKCNPKRQLRDTSRCWLLAILFSCRGSPGPLYPLLNISISWLAEWDLANLPQPII